MIVVVGPAAVVGVDPALVVAVDPGWVVALGALVVVDELELVGDEEQPARMPAAPSAHSAYLSCLHLT
jgi:hypothetical protein